MASARSDFYSSSRTTPSLLPLDGKELRRDGCAILLLAPVALDLLATRLHCKKRGAIVYLVRLLYELEALLDVFAYLAAASFALI